MSKEKTPVQLIIDRNKKLLSKIQKSISDCETIEGRNSFEYSARILRGIIEDSESIRDNQEKEALKDALTDGFWFDHESHNKHYWYNEKYGNG